MKPIRVLFVALSLGLTVLPRAALAQWGDPFASLQYGVQPACPFECDSVTLVLNGELTSTSWSPPELLGWTREGDSVDVRIRVAFNPDPTLPVLVPFELLVPLGYLPEGGYRVFYTIQVENLMATMPVLQLITVTDGFQVAPPGDQTCEGVVDVRDVVTLVNHIFRGGSAPDPETRADLNCDGRADISDLVQLVYFIFRGGSICDPCQPLGLLPISPSELPVDSLREDTFELVDAGVAGDTLHVRIAHGGGCLMHKYAVYWTPPSFEGPIPRIAHLYPVHVDPGDPCDAWLQVDVNVDLRLVGAVYRFIYGYDANEIALRIHAFDATNYIEVIYPLTPLVSGPNIE